MAKQQSSVKERQRVDIDEPRQFKVIFHNDDFTTFEFVVKVLMVVFFKSESEAQRLTFEVDRKKAGDRRHLFPRCGGVEDGEGHQDGESRGFSPENNM